ncbi:MAG: hypothetical protein WA474_10035 [Candidatus Sulfotelmatobacter sp.]
MKMKVISVTEAARNFADCVNRAHYQNVTFVLVRNGAPLARLVPNKARICSGRDFAEVLAGAELPDKTARALHRDLQKARRRLKPAAGKW